MEKLSMCRICLGEEIRMVSIVGTHLHEMYESLVLMPFETEDGRPILACYICRTMLKNCYELRKSCLQSEELFTQMLSCNEYKRMQLQANTKRRLTIHNAIHLSMGHVFRMDADNVGVEALKCEVKDEPNDDEDLSEGVLKGSRVSYDVQSADTDSRNEESVSHVVEMDADSIGAETLVVLCDVKDEQNDPEGHKKKKQISKPGRGCMKNKVTKVDKSQVKLDLELTEKENSVSTIKSTPSISTHDLTHHTNVPLCDTDVYLISSNITKISNSYESLSVETETKAPPKETSENCSLLNLNLSKNLNLYDLDVTSNDTSDSHINSFWEESPPGPLKSSTSNNVSHDAIISEVPTCSSNTTDTQLQDKNDNSSCLVPNYQNHDTLQPGFEIESDQSGFSNDQDHISPSDEASSSDEDHDLVMENGYLDESNKVVSGGENRIKKEVCQKEVIKYTEETPKDGENSEYKRSCSKYADSSGDTVKGKRIRQRDFCFYCKNFILNFSRHMLRKHLAEPEVQLALSYPKNSLKRKKVFSDLRKKGNYISNMQTTFKPVKKCRFYDKSEYLPCSKCLGFYSRKYLWKHKKKCNNVSSTKNTQVEAQNFLLRHIKVDNNLLIKVFPRMKPDKISLAAKKDKLICMFGAQYLKKHREDHFVTVISRKMRELAKLLMEVRKLKPNISCIEQMLKPQYYDILVEATKIVARYNETTGEFNAPTYAMNIATSIKQCCNVALLQSSKTDPTPNTASIQADYTILSKLITENWKFDISNQAANDLNDRKWNKTTLVRLAADLKLFKEYLCKVSKQSSDNLTQPKENINIVAFNNLVDSTYCRVLLLNRRRHFELKNLKLSDYNDRGNDNNKHEEFDKVLSPTEKILVCKLKRIVIRVKRGIQVPVFFSTDIQNDIKTILSVRSTYIEKDNNLLFVKVGGATVCDYKIFKKFAKACGAKNYKALTYTRLRKHLATMTQLFTMNESELEQLATFMGHTLSVHEDSCRLLNDVHQPAKISKLLLLIEAGKADKYQGNTLDKIGLNLEEELDKEDEIENEQVIKFQLEEVSLPQNDDLSVSVPSSQELTKRIFAKKKRTLVPWTAEQKQVVTDYFKQHIENKKPPKRAECDLLKNKYPTLLRNKEWLKIKVFIQNNYTKK